MKLHGKVGDRDVLILVDSGSVASFISTSLVEQLQSVPQECDVAKYMAADGSLMVCNSVIPNLQWATQGFTFSTTVFGG